MKEKNQSLDSMKREFIQVYAKGNEEEIRQLQRKICLKEHALMSSQKARTNPRVKTNPKFHKVGTKVRCQRAGAKYHNEIGTIVETYATLNGIFRNAAYLVKLDNGKIRSFQFVKQIG